MSQQISQRYVTPSGLPVSGPDFPMSFVAKCGELVGLAPTLSQGADDYGGQTMLALRQMEKPELWVSFNARLVNILDRVSNFSEFVILLKSIPGCYLEWNTVSKALEARLAIPGIVRPEEARAFLDRGIDFPVEPRILEVLEKHCSPKG